MSAFIIKESAGLHRAQKAQRTVTILATLRAFAFTVSTYGHLCFHLPKGYGQDRYRGNAQFTSSPSHPTPVLQPSPQPWPTPQAEPKPFLRKREDHTQIRLQLTSYFLFFFVLFLYLIPISASQSLLVIFRAKVRPPEFLPKLGIPPCCLWPRSDLLLDLPFHRLYFYAMVQRAPQRIAGPSIRRAPSLIEINCAPYTMRSVAFGLP